MPPTITRRRFFEYLGGATALAAGGMLLAGPGARVASATTATPPADQASPVPTDPLLIRIAYTGGFVPVEFFLTELPLFSLYASGRVITTGPMIDIFPAPALPNLRETILTDGGIAKVMDAASQAGLFDGSATYDGPPIADAGSVVFTGTLDGTTSVISAYALGFDETQVPDEKVRAARQKLVEFWTSVLDFGTFLEASDVAEPDHAYEIERLRIFNRAFDPASPPWQDPAMAQPPVAWPLDTPAAAFGEPFDGPFAAPTTCGVAEGDDARKLLDLLVGMNQLSPWESDGTLFQTWARPLLPDENGCR